MRQMWFQLMPYTELREDFREANPSAWVDRHFSRLVRKPAHPTHNGFDAGHLILLRYGNMNDDLARHDTRLSAERTMANLKDPYAGCDDRWWPKPLHAGERADIAAFRPCLAAGQPRNTEQIT